MKWYVLDVNPEPWKIGPVGVKRANGRLIPFVGRDRQLDSYKEAVREAIGSEEGLITGKVKLVFYFWRNRAEYETPQARSHRKHEADVTNMQKATEDALQSILFVNDKDTNDVRSVLVDQGPDVHGKIVIGIEKSDLNPGVALPPEILERVWELDKVPQSSRVEWGDDSQSF